jgi:hypothetical protein
MSDLNDLAGLLVDFMDLPGTLDLPQLLAVNLTVTRSEKTPAIEAQLPLLPPAETWDAVAAWAAGIGGRVEVAKPYSDGYGKAFRTLSVRASYVGHPVRVWAHIPADDEVPERYRQIAQVAA